MTDFSRGDLNARAEGFDAYVQFVFGADKYRLKSLQTVKTDYSFTKSDHYNDAGFKARVRDNYSMTAAIELVLTAEDFDTADPPTDVKTFSYFLYQKILGNTVSISVVEVFATKSTSNPIVRQSFTFDFQDMGTMRQVGDVVKLAVSGEIDDGTISGVTRPKFIRSAS